MMLPRSASAVACGLAALALWPSPTSAQQSVGNDDVPPRFDFPAPPVPPATITRNPSGQATVRAIRLVEPLELDGALGTLLPPSRGRVEKERKEAVGHAQDVDQDRVVRG